MKFLSGLEGGVDGTIVLDEHSSAPATPAAGNVVIYAKADGLPYSKDDGGTEYSLAARGDVTAAAVIANNSIVRGDGGAKGVQGSVLSIADTTGYIASTYTEVSLKETGGTGIATSAGTVNLVAESAGLKSLNWDGFLFSSDNTAGYLQLECGTASGFLKLDDGGGYAALQSRDQTNYWSAANGSLTADTNSITRFTITDTAITATLDIVIPDEAYGVGWNGSLEVPTKNAVYDKIETLVTGPASATDNALAAFDGTTGKLAQNTDLTYDGLTLQNAGSALYLEVNGGTGGDVYLTASDARLRSPDSSNFFIAGGAAVFAYTNNVERLRATDSGVQLGAANATVTTILDAADGDSSSDTVLVTANWVKTFAGGVDVSGTPVANDYARFVDADTIEGRSYAEAVADLGLADGHLSLVVDGQGSVITTGVAGYIHIPYDCTLSVTAEIISMDGTSGSIVLDLWEDSYANFPPTVADTKISSGKPTMTAATKSSTTVTYSTATCTKGNYIAVNVDSVTSLKVVRLSIVTTRTP